MSTGQRSKPTEPCARCGPRTFWLRRKCATCGAVICRTCGQSPWTGFGKRRPAYCPGSCVPTEAIITARELVAALGSSVMR